MKRQRDNGFSEWGGYMAAKVSKLEDQFNNEAANLGLKEDNLFEGISIFVNGYTVPPAYELRNLMMKHGGTFHHYHRPGKTTYIVASNLPDTKLKQVKKLIIIKPEWVVDCIKEGRLLSHKDYLLYTNHSKTQPLLLFKKPQNIENQSSAKTAKDDKFLSEFYKNSRLHLISTMGATFKRYVNEIRTTVQEFPGRDSLLDKMKVNNESEDKISDWGPIIMHIDMDCFFVSVSIRQRPDLIDKPVAVTHSKGNKPSVRPGVNLQAEYKAYHGSASSNPNHWSNTGQAYSMAEIASCSYKAREAGVKNGMFMGQALTLCPALVTLPYDFEGYKDVAKTLYDTVARYTVNIEAVSCDEMLVDCTDLLTSLSMTPLEFASILRNEIKEKTQCPCSTGFGANKLQARLATRKAKPDGQYFLQADMVLDFISTIPVSDLPGVGRSLTYKLKSMGISTCGELRRTSLSNLQTEFGVKAGEMLYNYAYGKDSKSLTLEKTRKSVSAEVNYGIRFQANTERDKFLKQLTEEVASRLQEISMKGKSISLKIMVKSKDAPEESAKFLGHGVCDCFTKTNSLKSHTDDPVIILREILSIMSQLNVPCKHLRGIGIQISKLISNQATGKYLDKYFVPQSVDKRYSKESFCRNESSTENLKGFSNCKNSDVSVSQISVDNHQIDEPIAGTSKPVSEESNNNQPEKKGNLCKMKKNELKPNNSVQPDLCNISLSQIDPSFLEALPKDLKTEVLGAVKKNPLKKNVECDENIEFRDMSNRFNGIDNTKTSKLLHSSNDLTDKISPVEMRGIIREWIKSSDSPQPCDVSIFSKYLSSLVISRQIDHLHILLKTFLRQLKKEERSSEWMSCYNSTLVEIQTRMLSVYGAKLITI